MDNFNLTYKQFGEKAILIEWPSKIDEKILNDILRFKQALNLSLRKSVDIVDVVTAYNSVTIIHRTEILTFERRIEILAKIYQKSRTSQLDDSVLFQIPVCYDSSLVSDQADFLKAKQLNQNKLIELHTKPIYRVYFLGFLPGFIYLGGLDQTLHCPRKNLPSKEVAKGSVAIGGEQTGVYPQQSPGGWHVIGMSPVDFFDRDKDPACFAQSGDRIRFESISLGQYHDLKDQVLQGRYSIKRENWNA